MALIYARLGTMEFARIAALLSWPRMAAPPDLYWLTGLALIFTGIGFKLSVVPFHMWAPDVYEGAPAPVTAFVAVVSKGAMFALLLRYFVSPKSTPTASAARRLMIEIVAIASMLVGNLLALLQNNVKRILAYSSIAHLGYLLVAFLAGGDAGARGRHLLSRRLCGDDRGRLRHRTVLSASGGGRDADGSTIIAASSGTRPWLAAALP